MAAMLAPVVLTGCSKPYVRAYEWRDERAAVETLAGRTESVRSVRAACALTMTDARGEAVNFDGAIVVRRREDGLWLRLRTWKVGQAVFDATVRPDGVWLMVSDQAARRMEDGNGAGTTGAKGIDPALIARGWSLFMGGFFTDPGARVIDTGRRTFEVERAGESGTVITAVVDRATLTVSEYRIADDKGEVRQTLTLSQYRELGPEATPFPTIIRAAGPEGTVEVRMQDVELNGVIEDAAFVPPRRAVKQ
jgi:hypothetical protein